MSAQSPSGSIEASSTFPARLHRRALAFCQRLTVLTGNQRRICSGVFFQGRRCNSQSLLFSLCVHLRHLPSRAFWAHRNMANRSSLPALGLGRTRPSTFWRTWNRVLSGRNGVAQKILPSVSHINELPIRSTMHISILQPHKVTDFLVDRIRPLLRNGMCRITACSKQIGTGEPQPVTGQMLF